MNQMFRNHIDEMFADAPHTKQVVEMKEEILQNLCDRYQDLISGGKTEESAYNIAVAGLGDFSELIEELKKGDQSMKSNENLEQLRIRSAIMTSVAVILYILCVIPLFLLQNEVGLVLMFVMIAMATGLLIFNGMTKPRMIENTMAGDFIEWRETNTRKSAVSKAINSAVWSVTVALYMLLSFLTRRWDITWLIFVFAASVTTIIQAIYDLKG